MVKQQAARDIKYPYGMLAYLSFFSPPLLLSSTYALKEFIKKNDSNAKAWISKAVAFIQNSPQPFRVYAQIIDLNSHTIPRITT